MRIFASKGRLVLSVAGSMMLLAGCSAPETGQNVAPSATTPSAVASSKSAQSTASSPTPTDTTAAPEPTTAVPEPVDTPDESPLVTGTFEDDDGYTYTMTLETFQVEYDVDVENAKPGEVIVVIRTYFTGTIANETIDRNAPLPEVAFDAVWKAGSPPCEYLSTAFYSSGEDLYCSAATNRAWPINTPSTLGINEVLQFEDSAGSERIVLEESRLPGFEEALTADPYSYVIGLVRNGRWTVPTSTCGLKYGTGGRGGYVAAASPTLPECQPQE